MPIDARTPAWLEEQSARPWNGLNNAARLVGQYAGTAIDAALPSGDAELDKKPYLDRFRTSMVNQQKSASDPNWRLKEMVAQAQYKASMMHGEQAALRGVMAFKSLQQQTEGEKELAVLASEAAAKGNDPLAVPYMGTNPFTQKMWGNAQLQYSRGLVQKRLDSDKVRLNKMVDELGIEDRSAFLQMPRGDDGMPTQEGWSFLNAATTRAQVRKDAKDFKPMSSVGRLIADKEKAELAGLDVTPFNAALNTESKNSELIFEEADIGGKKFTTIRQAGKGGFRLIPHSGDNKMKAAKLQAAYRQKQQALNGLGSSSAMLKEQKGVLQKSLDEAEKTITELEGSFEEGAAESAAPAAASPTNAPKAGLQWKFDASGNLAPVK